MREPDFVGAFYATRRDATSSRAETRRDPAGFRLPLPHRSKACSKLGDELLLIQNCMCERRGGDRGRDWRTHRARCILFSNWNGEASRLEVSSWESRSTDLFRIVLCPICRRKVEECWSLQRKNKQGEIAVAEFFLPPSSFTFQRSIVHVFRFNFDSIEMFIQILIQFKFFIFIWFQKT